MHVSEVLAIPAGLRLELQTWHIADYRYILLCVMLHVCLFLCGYVLANVLCLLLAYPASIHCHPMDVLS